MKIEKNNICKFVQNTSPEHIITTNFVYETNPEIINTSTATRTHKMFLVVSGNGKLITDTTKSDLTAGSLFFTFSDVDFKIENKNNLNYMYISFSGDRSDKLFKRYSVSPTNCIFEGNEGLVSFWQNSIARSTEKNLDLISESVLLYTFSQLTAPKKNKEQRLTDNILSYIDSNFTEFNLNLSSLSDELGYNSKYISRVFKQNTGTTFTEYLKHARIKHAIFLMEQGLTSVKNIALLSGYNDPLYFSNVFKKEIGISASEYINNNKKDR